MTSLLDRFDVLEAEARDQLEQLTDLSVRLLAASTRRWVPDATHTGLLLFEGNVEVMEIVTPSGSYASRAGTVAAVSRHTHRWNRWLVSHLPEVFHDNAIPVGMHGDLIELPSSDPSDVAACSQMRLWQPPDRFDVPFDQRVGVDLDADGEQWLELLLTDEEPPAGSVEVDVDRLAAMSAHRLHAGATSENVYLR